ncbi:MAG: S-adenosylmethionine:tRNA ribosyltransferase-isomerase [Solirubrobacteraceae bacterium]|jgi:S-adenosylmethionine:tRNA ribosyltransferase-isomerase|nr:S-adenosylmethionine:tRNA ribosyltransferase-isomerase [Solirubrobacteraceae bacterium]
MSALAFQLPQRLEARTPPEARGLARDQVRLLVAHRDSGELEHHRFAELPALLDPGDLVVINVSGTLPAALTARRLNGSGLTVHVSTRAPRLGPEFRIVELRQGTQPLQGARETCLSLAGGGELELLAPYAASPRLHLARFATEGSVEAYLHAHGQPIRYRYVTEPWPLASYQNVYATTPGSAEMPSAGRPFTSALITDLVARGILVAPILLHAGVSSPERDEPPFPEEYEVPVPTAALVQSVRTAGGRVIAVGTTVVRALETAARGRERPRAGHGWTSLIITPEHRLAAVDGLITGWHEPQASHLQMLGAIAGPELLEDSYASALDHGYLWHEFGDSHLILP